MNIIAVDCGASFIKAALIKNGEIVSQDQRKSPVVHLDEDITNPIQINALVSLVGDIIKNLGTNEQEITLCISNEMHGFLLSKADTTPVTDYISWQKEYGNIEVNGTRAIDILNQKDLSEDIFHTGMKTRAGLPSCNLLYLIKSGIFKANDDEKIYFFTLGDYILFALSGKIPPCHPTNAAATGLYDILKGKWNHKIISSINADKIIFPHIGEGRIDFKYAGIVIHAHCAIGDQQAALLGAGLRDTDSLSFNLGTGAQVSRLISKPVFSNSCQIRPYFYGQYIKTIPHLPSGRAINVYIRFIKDLLENFGLFYTDDKVWIVLLQSLENVSENRLFCDLSFFENAVTDHATGRIEHIEEYSFTVGNLMDSVVRTLSENFLWAATLICDDCNTPPQKIIFSGGIAKKIDKVRQNILSNYKESIVHIAENETLIGLYLYAAGKEYKNDKSI